jgi:photosystem II stability/assembly factor-like uncharacterized protein
MPSPIHALPFLMSAALAAPAPGTWRALNDNWSEPLKAHFADARHGWATGHQGLILRTSDGGANWIRFELPYSERPQAVHFPTARIGFVVSHHEESKTMRIHMSDDSGLTWKGEDTRLPINPSAIQFLDPGMGWVLGTIEKSESCAAYLTLSAIRFTSAGEAWAVGSRGTVLKLE